MRTLNIKDFSLKDFSKLSSEFINDTFKSFVDNTLYVFDALRSMNDKHDRYKIISDQTFDFLYSDLATLSVDDNTILAYDETVSALTTDVSVTRNYGVVTLESVEESGLISRADQQVSPEIANISNDDDGSIALLNSSIYKVDPINPAQVVQTDDMRYIIDESGLIWHETNEYDTMELVLTLPESSNRITYLLVYPYGGTTIDYIEFREGGSSTTIVDVVGDQATPDLDISGFSRPGFPVKVNVNKEDFTNEIRVHLKGYDVGGGQYFYSIGKIEPYVVNVFTASGEVTYDLSARSITSISDIVLTEPYIFPLEEVINFPIDIKIWASDDSSNPIYNTEVDEYPLDTSLTLAALPVGEKWYMTFTLQNTNGISPVFRKCVITP